MTMEIKMNKQFSFDDIAKELGCTVEDVQKMALENGLIDEDGKPTEFAIKNGYLANSATVYDEFGEVGITVSNSENELVAVCIGDGTEKDQVAFISREKAHALGELLMNM